LISILGTEGLIEMNMMKIMNMSGHANQKEIECAIEIATIPEDTTIMMIGKRQTIECTREEDQIKDPTMMTEGHMKMTNVGHLMTTDDLSTTIRDQSRKKNDQSKEGPSTV
jgi:hypothetical protein